MHKLGQSLFSCNLLHQQPASQRPAHVLEGKLLLLARCCGVGLRCSCLGSWVSLSHTVKLVSLKGWVSQGSHSCSFFWKRPLPCTTQTWFPPAWTPRLGISSRLGITPEAHWSHLKCIEFSMHTLIITYSK